MYIADISVFNCCYRIVKSQYSYMKEKWWKKNHIRPEAISYINIVLYVVHICKAKRFNHESIWIINGIFCARERERFTFFLWFIFFFKYMVAKTGWHIYTKGWAYNKKSLTELRFWKPISHSSVYIYSLNNFCNNKFFLDKKMHCLICKKESARVYWAYKYIISIAKHLLNNPEIEMCLYTYNT